jgi:hypothetical protein
MKEEGVSFRIFSQIETQLTEKLASQGYRVIERKIDIDRYIIIWTSEDEAIRLSWDEKQSWFIVEDCPITLNPLLQAWADICIVPCEPRIDHPQYDQEIIEAVVKEIK